MKRVLLALVLLATLTPLVVDSLLAGPTTGLPPIPWPVPPEHPQPKPFPGRMVPLQPGMGPQPVTLVPPPLLYVRIVGPAGSHVTFYRGPAPEKFDLPVVVGFRPGYQFRAEIGGIPGRPGVRVFPAFEIRGSLALSYKLKPSDFPATVDFKVEDLDRLRDGTVFKKIVVLERPDVALPQQSSPDAALELTVPTGVDPFTAARERGLPLAYVLIGPRTFEPAEMVVVPGTLYLPGDKSLPMPAAMPCVPWTAYPLVDPTLGPIHPSEYMSLYDGGDSGLPAGFDAQGRLKGLDPTDTVAEYVNSRGIKRLAISNRVALCIPRFLLIRTEATPIAQSTIYGPDIALATKRLDYAISHQELILRVQRLQLELAKQNLKPSTIDSVYRTAFFGNIKNVKVETGIQTPFTLDGAKVPQESPLDLPLLICKWPDRWGALIGEIVTFTLKYTNTGRQPIANVVVSDNLTPRFEYVPGTAKTDRDATFTFQPNDAGSHILRWEFNAELPPGEFGIITFQVRVR